jgi:hypothetical protein
MSFKCKECGIEWNEKFCSAKDVSVCKECANEKIIIMVVTITTISNWDSVKDAENAYKKKPYQSHEQEVCDKLDWLPIEFDCVGEDFYNHIESIEIKYKERK